MKTYIGIDNGVTGSIGIISELGNDFSSTPVVMQQNYTKKKGNIGRLVSRSFSDYLVLNTHNIYESIAIIERPMVNSARFMASLSAVRCLEAQLNVLESLEIPYMYIDSKEWQKKLLPKGTKGTADLKKASLDIGTRLFPEFKDQFKKQKDADGMLIAEYARRMNL